MPTEINKNKLYTSSYPGEVSELKKKERKKNKAKIPPPPNPGIKIIHHKNR